MKNPRVVVLTTYFRPIKGGVETSAERLARFLSHQGFPTRVVTKRISRDLPDREDMEGVEVIRIGPYGDRTPAGKWRLVPAATMWLVRHGLQHEVVCCIDYRGIGCAALAARALTRRPVIFQAQTGGILSSAKRDDLLGQSGMRRASRFERLLQPPATYLYKRADAFACISRDLVTETVSAGVPASRVHLVPNPVDMRRFRPAEGHERAAIRESLTIGQDRVVCAYVGRLSREKGVMDLVEAWRLFREHAGRCVPTCNPLLLVCGPDMPGNAWNVGPEARDFVARHGLNDSIRFLGPIDDVAGHLRAADLAVVPSHFEALGLSALEALACGVPVIASSVDGLLDFVVDGVNGVLHPPRDPAALAQRLSALLCDALWRQRLAAGARPSVIQDYDEHVVFSRFADVIKKLAEARR